ncbi:MAG TPA: hypothetical protein VM911_16210, partial [Pyrinomonadaceae bacterium]|nr:hypothetical protein [Pyrinomonadaceae bacterium]
MSEVMEQPAMTGATNFELKSSLRSYLPAILTITGALLMVGLRIQFGEGRFVSDGALMMLALACYLTAAVFHLMNLYA